MTNMRKDSPVFKQVTAAFLAAVTIACVSAGVMRPNSGSSSPGPSITPTGKSLTLPNEKDSLHFAVIGDSGTASAGQYRIANQMNLFRSIFPYEIVLMMGDNLYMGSAPADFEAGFEKPYKPLLDAGVKFYASLGNHDNTNQRLYKPFNMGDQRFYSFKPKTPGVRFFALDSNYMTPEQLTWLEKELAASQSDWKIVFFHHPLYSSGATHGSDEQLKLKLEPLFVKHNVDVVIAGHEHFYERLKPQKGIQYFISGGAGKLRAGDLRNIGLTAKGYDAGYHFMLMEIIGDKLHFQAIGDTGQTIDSGVIQRRPSTPPAK
jgi:predicted phosphodiesterase